MFNGKMKAITFSFDDGSTQDERLIYLLNKYGLKSTFNLNSGRFGLCEKLELGPEKKTVSHIKFKKEEIKHIYEGHEVAAHTLTHPPLINCNDDEVIRQVEQDRLALSEIVGYEVVGFAYPCARNDYDERVIKLIKENTGIKYCRNAKDNMSIDLQENLYDFCPTMHYRMSDSWEKNFQFVQSFLDLKPDTPKLLYIWGHSFSLDFTVSDWEYIEELFKLISGKPDIFYGTNKQVLL